jgi:hypothetical protein
MVVLGGVLMSEVPLYSAALASHTAEYNGIVQTVMSGLSYPRWT